MSDDFGFDEARYSVTFSFPKSFIEMPQGRHPVPPGPGDVGAPSKLNITFPSVPAVLDLSVPTGKATLQTFVQYMSQLTDALAVMQYQLATAIGARTQGDDNT